MRDVDERVAAVQRRTSRMKRKHDRVVASALTALTAIAFVGFLGVPVVSGQVTNTQSVPSLFGATSLFGPSAGGYVIVALLTAVVVALVTALCITRHRLSKEKRDAPENKAISAEDAGFRGR